MMSIYKINLEQIRLNPETAALLKALNRGFSKFDIDFYLVGAVSRNVWMGGIHNLSPRRTTGDIDFAVFINDKVNYETLKEYLIREEGFSSYHGNSFVLIWENGMQVDLLPFGAIEDEDGSVTITGTGYSRVHVDGFREVYDEGLPELELEDTQRFKFCTLPGIVLLKLIAWDDRPEKRTDDIMDISEVLSYFFDMNDHDIYENHNDLFEREGDYGLIDVAAEVLGRQLKKIAQRNSRIYKRIDSILTENITAGENSRIGRIMVTYYNNSVMENVKRLSLIRKGLTEERN